MHTNELWCGCDDDDWCETHYMRCPNPNPKLDIADVLENVGRELQNTGRRLVESGRRAGGYNMTVAARYHTHGATVAGIGVMLELDAGRIRREEEQRTRAAERLEPVGRPGHNGMDAPCRDPLCGGCRTWEALQ